MTNKFFSIKKDDTLHNLVLFFGLVMLAVGLPTSRALVSIAQGLLVVNWMVEPGHRKRIALFLSNKPTVIFCGVFVVYLVGLLWTSDLSHGLGFDIKNKLPFLTFPFVIASSKPLPKERILLLPLLFSVSVFAVSIIGAYIYFTNPFVDTRHLSPFTVHIFYGLMVLLTIFLFPWAVAKTHLGRNWLYVSYMVSVWLLFFLFLLGSLTVFASLVAVVIFLTARYVASCQWLIKRLVIILVLFSFLAMLGALFYSISKPLLARVDPCPEMMLEKTRGGNEYWHNLEDPSRENGHLVSVFIAEDELRDEWNEKSEIRFDSLDIKGNQIKHTIFRYLSSLGLRKDAEGLSRLKHNDIEAIENGVANHLYLKWPHFFTRVHQALWEMQRYFQTGNPSRYSFAQRVEVWKASMVAFKLKPIFGWGTGDVLVGVNHGLDAMNSLLENRRIRPHNQFLVLLLMVGLVGTIAILGFIAYFVHKTRLAKYFPARVFLVVVFVSMLGDMPFDYHMGINFFLYFLVYFGLLFPSIASSSKTP